MSTSTSFSFIPAANYWDTTPEKYWADWKAQREAHNAPKPPKETVQYKGYAVPVWFVVHRTKTGKWSTASVMGKVVAMLEPWGWEVKAGRSPVLKWIGAAHHGKRVYVIGSRITLNGEVVTLDELREAVGA